MPNKDTHKAKGIPPANERFLKIIALLQNRGDIKSDAELLRMANVHSTGALSSVKKGKTIPQKILDLLRNEFNVNLEYINTGKGPQFIEPKTPDTAGVHIGDRALLLNLKDHLLKLEAKIYGKNIQDCISEFETDTMLKERVLVGV